MENNITPQQQEQQHPQQQEATGVGNLYDYEVKITVIVGTPAEKMINCLKRGEAFTYKDKSVEGVSILEVWAEVDKDYWWD